MDHFKRDTLMSARYYTEGFLITHLCLVLSSAKVHSLSVVFFLGLSQASCMLRKTDAISAILLLKALISSPMLFSLICEARCSYIFLLPPPPPPSPRPLTPSSSPALSLLLPPPAPSSILSAGEQSGGRPRPGWFTVAVDV